MGCAGSREKELKPKNNLKIDLTNPENYSKAVYLKLNSENYDFNASDDVDEIYECILDNWKKLQEIVAKRASFEGYEEDKEDEELKEETLESFYTEDENDDEVYAKRNNTLFGKNDDMIDETDSKIINSPKEKIDLINIVINQVKKNQKELGSRPTEEVEESKLEQVNPAASRETKKFMSLF